MCETQNTTYCPYWKVNTTNTNSFTCMSACDSVNKFNLSLLCVTTCNGTAKPFLSQDGINCVSTCSSGYWVNESEAQCVTACSWPNTSYINSTYSSSVKYCTSSCPTGDFLNRADQNCLTSCTYVNSTLTNGNTVCEIQGNITNCPYYRFSGTINIC